MATNRFIETIREKVKYPNKDGQFREWDILNREQRMFLIECADCMESQENIIEELMKEDGSVKRRGKESKERVGEFKSN